MDRRQVISKLREHRDELTAAGIVHLRVFGSVARGEANDSSDVDLIAEFDNKKSGRCWIWLVLRTACPNFFRSRWTSHPPRQ